MLPFLALLGAAVGAAPFAGLTFREIGPAISGGRSTAVAGSNRDPHLYYAGGAGGGVFKSTDGGASWTAVFDREAAAPIGAIAIDPRNDQAVWVGTGESNPRNDVESGDGIYRTVDGGESWRHAGLRQSAHISAISIDPRNPRVVAVGALGRVSAGDTNRGVYVTRDNGAHWSRTLYVGPSSGVSSLVRVPNHPSTLFAGVWQVQRLPWTLESGGPHGGIYRSDDNGATWRKLSGHGLPRGLTGRIGLAAGTGERIYALVASREGDLWRSDDGGANWRVMPRSPLLGARPFYFSSIYVDPANSDRLINVSLILSLSTNGGRSFHAIAEDAGWDYHAIWWSSDGRRIINGSDEGVILSADGGARFWQPYDLPFAQPYHVGLDGPPPNYRVCIGLQDDNSWCGPSAPPNGIGVMNRDWYQVGAGDGMWVLADPHDPELVWSTSTNSDTGQVYLWDARTGQARDVSPDAESNGVKPASALDYRFNWDTPIAFTGDGKALVGGNVLFESGDRGETWSVISPDLTRNDRSKQGPSGGPISYDQSGAEFYDTILYIATTKLDPTLIWVTTDDGLVQITRTAGAPAKTSWQNVSPPVSLVPPWGRITCIDPGRFAAGTAFIAVERHLNGDQRPYVLRTDDFGSTWRSVAGDLPRDQYVRTVRQDPRVSSVLYAGTNRGVWVTLNGGSHWQPLRLNMPATAIYDLEIESVANDLVVGAHGRGVWILDDLVPIQTWNGADAASITLFAPRDAAQMWNWPPVNTFTDPVLPYNDYIGDGGDGGAIVTYFLPRAAKTASVTILDSRGRPIRHFKADDVPKDAGMNRTSWDLTEDGPVLWNGTYKQNRGPAVGPEVVPGRFTVQLTVDGITKSQPVVVKPDPRAANVPAMEIRHVTLARLFSQLSTIDTMLNRIDELLRSATPAQARRLRAVREQLTYDPRNIEDLTGPAQLREDVLDLISRVESAFAPATQAEVIQAGRYVSRLETIESDYQAALSYR
ncbi:MAG TPA: hypothetical protein VHS56_11470 [Candidatus Cybelea sp.]|nr:hypothetical protein [Candidatus Cybelea sp.]